jgi:nucleotide-binding universal stress UspA family protein
MAIRDILYPTDFSEPARYAGHYAAACARKLNASLHVLHVPGAQFPAVPGHTGLDLATYQEAGRVAAAARMDALLREDEFRGLDLTGSVSGAIVEGEILKAAEASDLMVLGTHGRTGLSRVMLGSVTEKVIGLVSCPVLAVKHPDIAVALPWGGSIGGRRAAAPAGHLLNILVPLDGSTLAERALSEAQELARAFEAVVILFLVLSPSMTLHGTPVGPVGETDQAEAKPYLDRKQQALRAEGLMAEAVIRTGDAATEILDYAAERAVDLIAMTTHGRSGLRRWLLGSVTNKVLRGASLPVLLSRAWARLA